MKVWLRKNWPWLVADACIAAFGVFVFVRYVLPELEFGKNDPPPEPVDTAALRVAGPETTSEWEAALADSIRNAADYLVRHQLPNGELPYEVDVVTQRRTSEVTFIRLMAGAGALYTTCRLIEDDAYCQAGDLALAHYFNQVVKPEEAPGVCFYSNGVCSLGGNAITIDVIYKRWQATGSTDLNGIDLQGVALQLGDNIAWLRNDDGSLIHAFDPHYGGTADESYYVPFYPGESLMALLELYEMTGDPYWHAQARETNAYMLDQEVTIDHWHSYSFRLFALLDELTPQDVRFANQIGQAILDDAENLNTRSLSISTASKTEALAALAVAFEKTGEPHSWLLPTLETYALYVMDHQLPTDRCDWAGRADMNRFEGGIVSSCALPKVRTDGQVHWINGAVTFLEYLRSSN